MHPIFSRIACYHVSCFNFVFFQMYRIFSRLAIKNDMLRTSNFNGFAPLCTRVITYHEKYVFYHTTHAAPSLCRVGTIVVGRFLYNLSFCICRIRVVHIRCIHPYARITFDRCRYCGVAAITPAAISPTSTTDYNIDNTATVPAIIITIIIIAEILRIIVIIITQYGDIV